MSSISRFIYVSGRENRLKFLTYRGKAIMLRAYGESIRLHPGTKSEDSRQDQGDSLAGPHSAELSCLWLLGLGNGGWICSRALAVERLDRQSKVEPTLCRAHLHNLQQYAVFQSSGLGVRIRHRARYGRNAQALGIKVERWQAKPRNTRLLMFPTPTSLCLDGLRIT